MIDNWFIIYICQSLLIILDNLIQDERKIYMLIVQKNVKVHYSLISSQKTNQWEKNNVIIISINEQIPCLLSTKETFVISDDTTT
jgi:hypothetical protein